MLEVRINFGGIKRTVHIFEESIKADEIVDRIEGELKLGISPKDFYVLCNGRLASNKEELKNGRAEIVPRIFGGKGGFGSMLRAIGAQIEKTTNREACRDLSGRRLRDINEEKRLKSWIDKQATREEEAVERKKKKLERLCAQPKHEFKDKIYEKERSTLTEKVGDAVEEGFKLAMASGSGAKRKINDPRKSRGKILALDLEIDSDELGSSDDESDSDYENTNKNTKSNSEPEFKKSKFDGVHDSHIVQSSSRDSEESTNKSSEDESDKNLNPIGAGKVALAL